MDKIIPLVSSGTEGPLGLKHLPRLWAKTLLSAFGRLPDGYKDVRPGFDFMILEGLGLDPDNVRTYIFEERPSYLQFEDWVKTQPEVDVSPENIAKVNEIVVARKKGEGSRQKMLEQNGLPLDSPIDDSIMLNNLDDWRELHLSLGE
ncbi:MAG: DUF5069 domain-containing protein [Verrucomicrobiota bacterium]